MEESKKTDKISIARGLDSFPSAGCTASFERCYTSFCVVETGREEE